MNLSRSSLDGELAVALPVDRVAIHDRNDAALTKLLQTHRQALAPLLLGGVALGEHLQGRAFSCIAQLLQLMHSCSVGRTYQCTCFSSRG